MKKQVKKLLGISLTAILATTVLVACAPKEESVKNDAKQTTKKMTTLKIGTMPAPDSLPLYVAKEKGYFKAENLDIQLQNFKSPKDRDTAIAGKQLDGSITDLIAFGNYAQGDLGWKIGSQATGYFGIVTNDATVKTVSDLANKSVTFLPAQAPQYYFNTTLENAGVKPSSVSIKPVPAIPARLELVENKQVTATVLPDPFITIAKAKGLNVIEQSDPQDFQATIIAFSNATIKQKEAVRGFYRAYNKAVKDINAGKAQDFETILTKNLGYSKEIMPKVTLPHYAKASAVNQKQLDNAVAYAKASGVYKKSGNFDRYVTHLYQ